MHIYDYFVLLLAELLYIVLDLFQWYRGIKL